MVTSSDVAMDVIASEPGVATVLVAGTVLAVGTVEVVGTVQVVGTVVVLASTVLRYWGLGVGTVVRVGTVLKVGTNTGVDVDPIPRLNIELVDLIAFVDCLLYRMMSTHCL